MKNQLKKNILTPSRQIPAFLKLSMMVFFFFSSLLKSIKCAINKVATFLTILFFLAEFFFSRSRTFRCGNYALVRFHFKDFQFFTRSLQSSFFFFFSLMFVSSSELIYTYNESFADQRTKFKFLSLVFYHFLFSRFHQELLNMEKTRTVSLQLDGKKNKKSKPKKKDLANGGVSQDGGEGSSANIKEKCHVM